MEEDKILVEPYINWPVCNGRSTCCYLWTLLIITNKMLIIMFEAKWYQPEYQTARRKDAGIQFVILHCALHLYCTIQNGRGPSAISKLYLSAFCTLFSHYYSLGHSLTSTTIYVVIHIQYIFHTGQAGRWHNYFLVQQFIFIYHLFAFSLLTGQYIDFSSLSNENTYMGCSTKLQYKTNKTSEKKGIVK